jgi:hypothetical protein
VIPQIRVESISGLRKASETLRNLADRFEQSASGAPRPPVGGAPGNGPGNPAA